MRCELRAPATVLYEKDPVMRSCASLVGDWVDELDCSGWIRELFADAPAVDNAGLLGALGAASGESVREYGPNPYRIRRESIRCEAIRDERRRGVGVGRSPRSRTCSERRPPCSGRRGPCDPAW